MPAGTLVGKVALVTGGSRGIGRGIAERLGSEGAKVVVNYVRAENDATDVVEAIRSGGGDAIAIRADVASVDDVQRMVEATLRQYGQIDILVNNAGWDVAGWFVDTDLDLWRRVIDVNFTAVLLTCRYVLPPMLERRSGRIINIGSATAKIGFPTEAVYSGAKGAVAAFTRSLAREVGDFGITVNVVSPGPTETPLTDQFNREIEADPTFKRVFPDGPVDTLTKQIPLGRFGRPGDIAEGVAFLAGDGAGFITGQVLSIDGGFTM